MKLEDASTETAREKLRVANLDDLENAFKEESPLGDSFDDTTVTDAVPFLSVHQIPANKDMSQAPGSYSTLPQVKEEYYEMLNVPQTDKHSNKSLRLQQQQNGVPFAPDPPLIGVSQATNNYAAVPQARQQINQIPVAAVPQGNNIPLTEHHSTSSLGMSVQNRGLPSFPNSQIPTGADMPQTVNHHNAAPQAREQNNGMTFASVPQGNVIPQAELNSTSSLGMPLLSGMGVKDTPFLFSVTCDSAL